MSPETKRQFRTAAVVLGAAAIGATAIMIGSGFITSGPRWTVTLVGTTVAFSAIGSVFCLFLMLFDSES